MKKNLAVAVALLLVAVFSLGIASFAFFSGFDESGKNTVNPGTFDFSLSLKNSTDSAVATSDFDFKFPTKINFPKIGKDSPEFSANGDDEYFNTAVVPVYVTVQNGSETPMKLDFDFLASHVSGTDFSSCLEWFIFSPLKASEIKSGAKIDEKMHSICDLLSTSEIDKETTTIMKSLKRLEEGRRLERTEISSIEIGKGASLEVLIGVWLDYEKFNAIYNNLLLSGKVKISITAKATQSEV